MSATSPRELFKPARTWAPFGKRFSGACVATGLAALAFGTAPAAAHPDTSAQAASLCGSGYSVVDDPDGTPARRAVKTNSGAVYGHVYLTYNNGNGRNCVVTIKSRFHDSNTYTTAGLAVQGKSGPCDGWFCDYGNFAHFAGGPPDYKATTYAAGNCVAYWGQIFSGPNAQGTLAEGGRLRWGNCGS